MTTTTWWDGELPTPQQLEFLGLSSYGCYTFFQVRRKSVKGLALHLDRLRANGQELFGDAPAQDRLHELLEQVVSNDPCSVRVTLVSQDVEGVLAGRAVRPEVVVSTSAPKDTTVPPISVRTTSYARETPWVKHRATYGLTRQTRAARQAGFDDALFVSGGAVTEGATWNLLLRSQEEWVWPAGDVLNGVTMQLLSWAMAEAGQPQTRREVRASDLAEAQAAFAVNASSHCRAIHRIDDQQLTDGGGVAVQLEELWRSIAPEQIGSPRG